LAVRKTILQLPETPLRRKFFEEGSFIHPAKMHLGMLWEIIENHTAPGDLVLDPMAGIGSTIFAAMLGRDVITVELEDRFIKSAKKSWELTRVNGPMLGYRMGAVSMIQGDATKIPVSQVDSIVFSPPYEEALSGAGIAIKGKYDNPDLAHSFYSSAVMDASEGNIGALKGTGYWSAMSDVYRECARVLKPNGQMTVVLRDVIRKGALIGLTQSTVDMVEEMGLQCEERWDRELYSLSFFRTLQKRKGLPVPTHEHVLVFRKENR